jgi:hypothetical protein
MTASKLRLAMAAMAKPEIKIGELGADLEITRQTLYKREPRDLTAACGCIEGSKTKAPTSRG